MRVASAIAWFAVWVLLLGLGAWYIRSKEWPRPPADYARNNSARQAGACRAQRQMDKSYRLSRGDLDCGTDEQYIGRYLPAAVDKGDPIVLSALQETPRVAPSAGESLFVVPLRTVMAFLNAGVRVDLWCGTQPIVEDTRVLAVQCDAAKEEPTNCAAVLSVPHAVRLLIGDLDGRDCRFLLRDDDAPEHP